jgi:cation transport regulator ChaB
MNEKLVFCGMILSLFAILNTAQAFAISDDEIKATEKIKNNPAMMQILKKIEQSKKILAEMQEWKKAQAQQNKALQEARAVASARLSAELDSMSKDNEPFTPQNAFAKFVSKKPAAVQDIYASMFNYQQGKIKSAQSIREHTMASTGNVKDAWNAYYKNSATNRVQMVSLAKDLNVRYANADAKTQQAFDSNGKIPRTD